MIIKYLLTMGNLTGFDVLWYWKGGGRNHLRHFFWYRNRFSIKGITIHSSFFTAHMSFLKYLLITLIKRKKVCAICGLNNLKNLINSNQKVVPPLTLNYLSYLPVNICPVKVWNWRNVWKTYFCCELGQPYNQKWQNYVSWLKSFKWCLLCCYIKI